MEEKKFRVYELDFGDTNLLTEKAEEVADWIQNDMEQLFQTESLEYKITVKMMTRAEINEIPEWS